MTNEDAIRLLTVAARDLDAAKAAETNRKRVAGHWLGQAKLIERNTRRDLIVKILREARAAGVFTDEERQRFVEIVAGRAGVTVEIAAKVFGELE